MVKTTLFRQSAALGLAIGLLLTIAAPVRAERIKEIATLQGVRTNQLLGYGLVVGLDGSGDQTTQAPFTAQSVNSMLSQLGIQLPPGVTPQLRNSAAVMSVGPDNAFVVLNYGANRGAQVGQRFAIRSGSDLLATVSLSDVRSQFSIAQVEPDSLRGVLHKGDLALLTP